MGQEGGVVLSGKAKGLEAEEECDSVLVRAGDRVGGRAGIPALKRCCSAHTTDDTTITHHGSTIPDSNEIDFQVFASPLFPIVRQIWGGH